MIHRGSLEAQGLHAPPPTPPPPAPPRTPHLFYGHVNTLGYPKRKPDNWIKQKRGHFKCNKMINGHSFCHGTLSASVLSRLLRLVIAHRQNHPCRAWAQAGSKHKHTARLQLERGVQKTSWGEKGELSPTAGTGVGWGRCSPHPKSSERDFKGAL